MICFLIFSISWESASFCSFHFFQGFARHDVASLLVIFRDIYFFIYIIDCVVFFPVISRICWNSHTIEIAMKVVLWPENVDCLADLLMFWMRFYAVDKRHIIFLDFHFTKNKKWEKMWMQATWLGVHFIRALCININNYPNEKFIEKRNKKKKIYISCEWVFS